MDAPVVLVQALSGMRRSTPTPRAEPRLREVSAHTWELRGHDLRWAHADAVERAALLLALVAIPLLMLKLVWLTIGHVDAATNRVVLLVGVFVAASLGLGSGPRIRRSRWAAHRVELRRDGISFGAPGRLRFLPFAEIAGAERDGADVTFVARDGGRHRLVTAYVRRGDPDALVTFAEREAVAIEILRAIQRGPVPAPTRPPAPASPPPSAPADLGATLALLARRGRPADEWHAELRSLSAADAHYRVVTLREDTLVRIAEDPSLDEDARAAAALVLATRRQA